MLFVTEAGLASFATTTTVLRPPRVAVLFRGDERWREWAKLGLGLIGEVWGGLGFVLVPYAKDGSIDRHVAEVVAAYDPDHVVAMSTGIGDWERIAPGELILHGQSGDPLTGEARAALLRQAIKQGADHIHEMAEIARRNVSELCTPLRELSAENADRDIDSFVRRGEASRSLVSAADFEDLEPVPCLAASPSWVSDAGLLAAMRAGLLDDPSDLAEPRPEPSEASLLKWLIAPGRNAPPDAMIWCPPGLTADSAAQLPLSLRTFDHDLDVFTSSVPGALGAIVVGETAADFALAMIYDRLLGYGLWLTPTMLRNSNLRDRIRLTLEHWLWQMRGSPQKLHLTSASLTEAELGQAAADLTQGPAYPPVIIEGAEIRNARAESISIGPPPQREGRRFVAIREPLGVMASVPVLRDDDGTVTMQAPPASVLPARILPLRNELSVPYWLIEVAIYPDAMPDGRGLRPRWLQATDGPTPAFPPQVRSSRDGITYAAQSQGFILAGSNLESRIARPRLRQLGMRSWVEAMATDHGLRARLSNPGTQAQLVAKRLGGRTALLDLMSNDNLACLRRFTPVATGRRSDQEFPDCDGVVLASDPYPTRAALERLAEGNQVAVGILIDRLSAARLLRRGLVLGCAECQRPSFISIDELGQVFRCQRCASVNELTSQRWRDDAHEPNWFYDLHPSFRELIGKNGGDLVLLAAAYLRKHAQSYRDVPEMEFLDATGQRIAEIDLIALTDKSLVQVEVKAAGSFGTTTERDREIAKKLRIAEVLRTDSIVLATPQDTWTGVDVTALRQRSSHPGRHKPEVRTLTGLGPGTGQLT